MIPEMVAAAKRILDRNDYAEAAKDNARKVLAQWHEVPCPYCDSGIVTQPCVGRYICHVCEGTSKAWVKAQPAQRR